MENKEEEKINIKRDFRKIGIIVYAFRFFFNILAANKNNNFYYLLSITYKETINSNFIPGNIINHPLKISFEKIKDNLIKNPKSNEYLCSCGNHYSLLKYNELIECQQCQLKKNKKYSLFGREYYGRIFLNEKERDSFYSKYHIKEANLLLKDLEKKIEEQIKPEKGLKKESKKKFLEKNNDDIRYISYRLLNFILYSFIFYLNIEEKISDEEMENYLVEEMSCFEILEKNWEIMNKEIRIRQIPNIHIFLDNIFHELINEINNQKSFKSEKDLTNFEKNIENIIKNELNYKNSINNYIENRNKYLDIEPKE